MCVVVSLLFFGESKIFEHFSGYKTAIIPNRQIKAKTEPTTGFRHGTFSITIAGETNVRMMVVTNPKVEMTAEKTSINLSGGTEGM